MTSDFLESIVEFEGYNSEQSKEPGYYVISRVRETKRRSVTVSSPKDIYTLIKDVVAEEQREIFHGLYLSTKNHLIRLETISIGSLNAAIVHPREILKPAIKYSAASFAIAHNHPSGDPQPSAEDIAFTKRMAKCGDLMGIKLIDHVVVGKDSYFSLKEAGYF